MSIEFELVSFELGGVLPYGWEPFLGKFGGGIMGHEFTMVGTFKIKNKWKFGKGKTVSQLPNLIWAEKEFWFEGNLGGTAWTYKGENDKGDLYQSAPRSPTWGGFRHGIDDPRGHIWVEKPGGDIDSRLHNKLLNLQQYALVVKANSDIASLKTTKAYRDAARLENVSGRYNESMLKRWWLTAEKLGDKNRQLPCVALDRPGMAMSGGSGRSGGGFVSLTTSPSRRRILQFDLGIVGRPRSFTATQVLETIDGKPSISKFIIPGKDDHWCKNIPDRYLEYWRSRLNPANVLDQTTELESDGTVQAWENWVEGLRKKNLV